jgi:putative membrane protein
MEHNDEKRKSGSPSDHLANERTFLAWIRTGIAIMAFGFVVVKFSLFIRQLSILFSDKLILPGKGYSAIIGIFLVALGALTVLSAYFRYRNIEKQLNNNTYFPSAVLSILLTVSILIGSVLLVLYLLPSI